jgi:hypothetical protein
MRPPIDGGGRRVGGGETGATEGSAMFDIERISEWRGQDVLDPGDQRVGRLEEIYYDRYDDSPGFACVKTGLFGRRLSFVPLTGASMAREHIRVAYPADEIKRAPSVDPDGQLTATEEAALFAHYGLESPIDPDGQPPRLVRYQTEAAAAQVAEARDLVADQGELLEGGASASAAGGVGADVDRLSSLEERVAAIEHWLAAQGG